MAKRWWSAKMTALLENDAALLNNTRNHGIIILGVVLLLLGLVGPNIAASLDHPLPNAKSGTVDFVNPREQSVYFILNKSDCSDLSSLKSVKDHLRHCEVQGISICYCAAALPAGNYSVTLASDMELKVLSHLDGDGFRRHAGLGLLGVGAFLGLIGITLRIRRFRAI